MKKIARMSCIFSLMTLGVSVFFTCLGSTQVIAAEWPRKDITFIVPYSPGGGHDLVARVTAPFIKKHLPKEVNVVVRNNAAAAGKMGIMEVVKATPDGCTIGTTDPKGLAYIQATGQLKDLDVLKLTWFARLFMQPNVFIVGTKGGFKSPADMKNKKVRLASMNGSSTLAIALVGKVLEVEPVFIVFEGSSQASIATMQGDNDAFLVQPASGKRYVNAGEGKLIPMFVCTPERVPEWEAVPSAKELGVNIDQSMQKLLSYSNFLFAAPNVPPDIRKMWEETMDKVIKDKEWLGQMNKVMPPSGMTGDKALHAWATDILETTEKYKTLHPSVGVK